MESNFSTISTLTALHFPLLPILSTPTPLSPLVLPFPHSLPHSPIRMHPGPYGPAPPLPTPLAVINTFGCRTRVGDEATKHKDDVTPREKSAERDR